LTNSSFKSSIKIFSGFIPSSIAFFLAGSSSSSCPTSAVNVTTSHPNSSCSHFKIMLVSSPPE